MAALTQETLEEVLSTLTALQNKAEHSKNIFRHNFDPIRTLKKYIEDNKKILTDSVGITGDACRKQIIDDLAKLQTKDPKKITTIGNLIDQLTDSDAYSAIYSGLRKLELKEAFSDFIKTKGGKGKIEEITNYIKTSSMSTLRSVDGKKTIRNMFLELARISKDSEKINLINLLKNKLDGVFANHENSNLAGGGSINMTEVQSDWGRFFQGNGVVKIANYDNAISSLDDLKEGIINHLFLSSAHHHEQLTFSEGKSILDKDLVDNLLQAVKVVNMCGTDKFADQGVMISQDPANQDAEYNFKKLRNGNIQVDFKCSGYASTFGTKDKKDGKITVKAIFVPNRGTLEIDRLFAEGMKQPSSKSQSKNKKK